ncbi:uncharacterized protein LOC131167984 isoform X1 [Malania oleifera]|uniref:uncharacterized protein LOC131167984 isoform X1 n=1 Tax=Malania oleifera TaxID=397392 RepID=UPI0025AE2225|nr:uncharacterized protein LOC131167984 isoform X1 [Malania oleifera]XP_057983083.1 uncharacterized protein LOC131167984 isoform X1 [Malania oleifera]XP_057983084.1 uncharacterized protein LOC131167984 isoform X1 [Malania oleifera]XP_057983085.1 uncharacterized protein LOC131167984 isoform X1 [Malania oleifera]
MNEEKDAFYVVWKGDIIAVYNSLSDCLAQAGSSVRDSSLAVYKGYRLPRESEEYLVSHGLKNATYSISVNNVKDNLFGALVPCPFQQLDSSQGKVPVPNQDPPRKRLRVFGSGKVDLVGSSSTSTPVNHVKLGTCIDTQAPPSNGSTCIVEFDGASKGNPGPAGAGAVLRAGDGSLVYRLREGVGIATNNVAEYRGLLLGLKCALKKGFQHINVRGDSNLVCMQVQGIWKTKKQNMANLCKEVKEVKDKFLSFQISHILREYNSEADAQANLAINLRDGEIQEDFHLK